MMEGDGIVIEDGNKEIEENEKKVIGRKLWRMTWSHGTSG